MSVYITHVTASILTWFGKCGPDDPTSDEVKEGQLVVGVETMDDSAEDKFIEAADELIGDEAYRLFGSLEDFENTVSQICEKFNLQQPEFMRFVKVLTFSEIVNGGDSFW